MSLPNVIVVIVDRLQAPIVGAYGNTWIKTPELDRLASESFLFDRAVIDSPDLEAFYRGVWRNAPVLWPTDQIAPQSLLALAGERGWHTALVTDAAELVAIKDTADFAEQIMLEPPVAATSAAEIEQTQIARLTAAASQWLSEASEPFFLWLHYGGLGAAWDAPLELRHQYADEEDPTPPATVAPPCYLLSDGFHPDEPLGIAQAYAGQISLFDTCLGALLDQLREGRLATNTLFVLASARGFPLGEHRRMGPVDDALYNETVQQVLMLRTPGPRGAPERSQALVIPADLGATLTRWCAVGGGDFQGDVTEEVLRGGGRSLWPLVRGQADASREGVVLCAGEHEWAVRTQAWHLRRSVDPNKHQRLQLFTKPSDRFEVSDVADRCPQVVTGLCEVLERARRAPTDPPSALDPSLVTELD